MIKRSICATKSIKKAALLALMAIGLTACSTQEIPPTHNYGVVTSGDFGFMKHGVMTYSWHPESEKVYLSQKYDETVVTDLVRDSIQEQLSSKGYQLKQDGVGDVVVGFGLAEESELNDESIFDAIKLSTGVPFYDGEGKVAEKGSLYIAFFVPNSEVVQWQALAQSGIQPDLEPSESKQRITGFVEMLFRRMPER
ncbi:MULTISPECIES: DUF4136 domain-containing protein [Vibrio]|jgi:hypothetical protein|uniref:DUF4136 domain-containing protein n=1 Tax=Vibrio TaxID=662 RepID=UPI00030531ED|nr:MULTISPECIES: DUF4136 domain-containing protein [Vibrio]OEE91912.1 hypothetical protein A140_13305 [Vibrio crassostreae 9ZC88]OEE95153.1 hypothetical protein A138_04520 [Vibrio crassostreae 9ZC77]OEF01675.1 hypothetical protein A136_03275 [Vibrio crassostreae 9ZC13]PMK23719.1 hypothetical protein BCU05_09220 [Vibrio sp. 10N.261.54.C3]TKF40905.1 DUF4136 domain-containing protein [Vibrio sp. F13]